MSSGAFHSKLSTPTSDETRRGTPPFLSPEKPPLPTKDPDLAWGTSQNLISLMCFQASTAAAAVLGRRTRMESGRAVPAVGVPAERQPRSRRAKACRLPAAPRSLARPPGRSKGQPRATATGKP